MPKIKELQFKYELESSLNDGSIFYSAADCFMNELPSVRKKDTFRIFRIYVR